LLQVVLGLIEVRATSYNVACPSEPDKRCPSPLRPHVLGVWRLAYPAIIQSAFGLFACKTLADESRTFRAAPHLNCDSDEAHVARAVGAASLAVWGVCFPLVLGVLIRRFSSNPKYSFVIVSYGYKPALRYWEAWECMKKFWILFIITFLSTPELFRWGTRVCRHVICRMAHPTKRAAAARHPCPC
jgi:hypothetical protein